MSYTDGNGTSEGPLTSAQTAAVVNVNDTPVGVPTTTGTATENQLLTAVASGISDDDGLGTLSYEWLRDGVAIGGATASTYTLAAADVGTLISVRVSYTDGHGTSEGPLTSAQTASVNGAPVGVPTITGTATEDQLLTAVTSGISDDDGLGAFSYEWLRDGVAIGGATAATYTLGDADVGTQISVRVSYIDGNGTSEGPLTSAQTTAVVNVNDTPVGIPTITGTVTEDQMLTAVTSGISDDDGLGAFSYEWLRDGVAIGGATAATYTLGDADVGAQISVRVSYTDGNGTNEGPLTSAQTAAVANVNDVPVGLPTITGTVTEDQLLTAVTSGISDADGLGAFSYEWLRDGVAVGGATANTFSLGDADVGAQISVRVSYTDGQGTSEGPLTSAQTAAVANVNDTPVGLPTITGKASEDELLTALTNGISDDDGLGVFSYQWLRDGVAIGGATASTYLITDIDVDKQISVRVSYTDSNGTSEGPLTSTQVAVTKTGGPPTDDDSADPPDLPEKAPVDESVPIAEEIVGEVIVPRVLTSVESHDRLLATPPQALVTDVEEAIEAFESIERAMADGIPKADFQKSVSRTSVRTAAMTSEHSVSPAWAVVEAVANTPIDAFAKTDPWRASVDEEAGVSTEEIVIGASQVVMTGLSVGFAVYLIRGGTLVASVAASQPAWMSFDPFSGSNSLEEFHPSNQ